MKSSELALLKWMLSEYDWSSSEQTKEEFIKEFTARVKDLKVVRVK